MKNQWSKDFITDRLEYAEAVMSPKEKEASEVWPDMHSYFEGTLRGNDGKPFDIMEVFALFASLENGRYVPLSTLYATRLFSKFSNLLYPVAREISEDLSDFLEAKTCRVTCEELQAHWETLTAETVSAITTKEDRGGWERRLSERLSDVVQAVVGDNVLMYHELDDIVGTFLCCLLELGRAEEEAIWAEFTELAQTVPNPFDKELPEEKK